MSDFRTPKGTTLPLLDMRGKPYLQIAHRLVWFREEKPGYSIETDYVSITETSALAKAVIRDEQGRVLSQAHKYEDKQGFADFREKAETGAVGRALAMIGYGTQFCADELDEGERIADGPIQPAARPPSARAEAPTGPVRGVPPCECGNQMIVSRYNPNELYCMKCKAKRPRAA